MCPPFINTKEFSKTSLAASRDAIAQLRSRTGKGTAADEKTRLQVESEAKKNETEVIEQLAKSATSFEDLDAKLKDFADDGLALTAKEAKRLGRQFLNVQLAAKAVAKANFDNARIELNRLNKIITNKKIWCASSTHQNEELYCGLVHKKLKKKYKNIITIIIPRHIHRVHEIINELNRLNLRTTIHSSKNKNLRDTDIYIVDTFGESKKFYKIATSVFLGGSLINKGGQNPLEPTRYGAKILHGQFISNFKEIYKLLSKLKISKKISTPNQFEKSIEFKKNKKNLNKIKKLGTSILKKTLQELNGFILR
mgnify:CR=1 FL=1